MAFGPYKMTLASDLQDNDIVHQPGEHQLTLSALFFLQCKEHEAPNAVQGENDAPVQGTLRQPCGYNKFKC